MANAPSSGGTSRKISPRVVAKASNNGGLRKNKSSGNFSGSVSLGSSSSKKSKQIRQQRGEDIRFDSPSSKTNTNHLNYTDTHHGSYSTNKIIAEIADETTPIMTKSKSIIFDLSAQMHKRRGGLGRNADNNWVPRFFTLYGSVLCYYDSPDQRNADPSRPRNRVNLAKEEISVKKVTKQKTGAPTRCILVVYIVIPLAGKRKWEICCNNAQQQETWYEALCRFTGKPEGSSGSPTNRQRSFSPQKVDGGGPNFSAIYDTMVGMDDSDPDVSSPSSIPPLPASRRMSSLSHLSPSLVTATAEKNNGFLSLLFSAFSHHGKNKHVLIPIGVLNAAVINIRHGSGTTASFWFSVLFSNLVVIYICTYLVNNPNPNQHLSIREQEYRTITDDLLDDASMEEDEESQHSPVSISTATSKLMEAGSSFTRATALSPSLKDIIHVHGISSHAAVEAIGRAVTPDEDYTRTLNSYWNTDSSIFNLRVGPNYKRNKLKAPSAPALFNLHMLDVVKNAKSCVHRLEDAFQLPHIPGVTDKPTGHPFVPPMIAIVMNCPMEEPGLFNSAVDGPSYVMVAYLVISDKTREELQDIENASPAVKLLADWCKHAETDDVCSGRFKIIGLMDDIESLGLPGFIAGFNGKPALCTKSGTFIRHTNYIEFTVNVHMWAFIAKKGLHSLSPRFSSFSINAGFTIEGRSDEEQPECLLGGVKVMNLDLENLLFITSS